MDWNRPLDQYCERTDASFFSEPLNFVTNLAFILAAFALARFYFRQAPAERKPGAALLIVNVAIIGMGSGMFHSLATYWSMWADVIPIGLFVLIYFVLFLRYEANLGFLGVFFGLCVFGIVSLGAALLADHNVANGSEMYFGTWICLFGVACYLLGKPNRPGKIYMPLATVLFSLSLFLRTIDMRVCDNWPVGTHLGWHVLNGAVLYGATMAYLVAPQKT